MKIYFPLLLLLLAGCSRNPAAGDAIYYWKTTWQLDTTAQAALLTQDVARVYVRLFDLDWNPQRQETLPRAPLLVPDTLHLRPRLTLTPVVFITNRTWRHEPDPTALGHQLAQSIDRFTAKYPALTASQHLQIDCDWTSKTRDAYFQMLEALRRAKPDWTLSATIRLHQYRDRATAGIPPVDRGLLMCYNMAPVAEPATRDAIFDPALLKGYLKASPYPLPLDAALPLFTWGAAFRGTDFLGISPAPEAFAPGYLNPDGMILRDTVIGKLFLRPGDFIRGDGLGSEDELEDARRMIEERVDVDNFFYFDWQGPNTTIH